MSSGWIINFKDGTAVILSEKKYKEYRETVDISTVADEEHWFDVKQAIAKHPWLEFKE